MINTKILDVLSWIFLAIFVIFALWYIFGSSPVETTFLFSLVSLLLVKVWKMSNEFSYFRGDYTQFKENCKESFQRTREDMEEMKTDVKEIKGLLRRR